MPFNSKVKICESLKFYLYKNDGIVSYCVCIVLPRWY